MSIAAKDVTFNGKKLTQLTGDYWAVDVDNKAQGTDVDAFTADTNMSDIHYNSPINDYYNRVPKENLSLEVTIVKENNDPLTKAEVIELNKWLLGPTTPKVLSFEPCGYETGAIYDEENFIGVFVESHYVQNGTTAKYGITYKFNNISPYSFTEEKTFTVDSTGSTASLPIENTGTALGVVIHPTITITPTASGTVTLRNKSDNNTDALELTVTNGRPVTITDRIITYTSTNQLYDFDTLKNFCWPTIVDGTNEFEFTGPAKFEVKTRFLNNFGV